MQQELINRLGYSVYQIGKERWSVQDLLALREQVVSTAPNQADALISGMLLVSVLDQQLYLDVSEQELDLCIRVESKVASYPAWLANLMLLCLTDIQDWADWQQGKLFTPEPKDPRWQHCPLARELGSSVELRLPLTQAQTANPKASASQYRLGRKVLRQLRRQSSEAEELLTTVQQYLRAYLNRGASLEHLALQLHMSSRTLQRQFKYRGTSFSALLEQERKSQALARLSHSGSVASIAAQLGYDEPANFNRAFRKWFGMSPRQYRQIEHTAHGTEQAQAVALHYAMDFKQQEYARSPQGGQVWLELSNLGFEKNVWVECLDRDGVWRAYRASFSHFLRDGVELWSTSVLPVASPMRFRIVYEVNGQRYTEDNHGKDYLLQQQFLLGQPSIVCHHVIQVQEQSAWRTCAEVLCKASLAPGLVAELLGQGATLTKLQLVQSNPHYQLWQLSYLSEQPIQRLRIIAAADGGPETAASAKVSAWYQVNLWD